jgi:hypothetical protein
MTSSVQNLVLLRIRLNWVNWGRGGALSPLVKEIFDLSHGENLTWAPPVIRRRRREIFHAAAAVKF